MKVLFKHDMKVPAKIWTDDLASVESQALDQAELVCSQDWAARAAFMPDMHAGKGCTIGAVIGTKNTLVPNLVGVDIGCGMCVTNTNIPRSTLDNRDFGELINRIKKQVPMGFGLRNKPLNPNESQTHANAVQHIQNLLGGTPKWLQIALDRSKTLEGRVEKLSVYLGTLGGGNHFIEFQEDEATGLLHVMLHSGSRGPGEAIATGFMQYAKELNTKWNSNGTRELAYLPVDSAEGQMYLEAVRWAQDFAQFNRAIMMHDVLQVFKDYLLERQYATSVNFVEVGNIHHNYVNQENHFGENLWVHRKGATRVRDDITGIIPGSMGTRSYIVRGTNSVDSLNSCSHGAGRAMSRTKAKATITIQDFQDSMKGIISHDVNHSHIDESPMAYKDIDVVMANQQDLVTILKVLKPVVNLKG